MRYARTLAFIIVAAGIFVSAAAALRFTDESYFIPQGVVGAPYLHRFSAPPAGESGAGCDPPYVFRVDSGALPPGLSLGTDGVVRGTPRQAGNWSFWVSMRDDPTDKPWCNPLSTEREFTAFVGAPPATVGTTYSLRLGATGDAPQVWSIASGLLPPGLALESAVGAITGTPEIAGSFPLQLFAIDRKGLTAAVDLTIIVSPKLAFATRRLVSVQVGRLYRAKVRTRGGVGTVKLKVLSGRFPIGIRLNVNTGVIGGKPSTAGVYRITIAARDALGRTAMCTFALTVRRRLA